MVQGPIGWAEVAAYAGAAWRRFGAGGGKIKPVQLYYGAVAANMTEAYATPLSVTELEVITESGKSETGRIYCVDALSVITSPCSQTHRRLFPAA